MGYFLLTYVYCISMVTRPPDIFILLSEMHVYPSPSISVLVAEVVKHFMPPLVELHNYAPANSVQQKATNWNLLNR